MVGGHGLWCGVDSVNLCHTGVSFHFKDVVVQRRWSEMEACYIWRMLQIDRRIRLCDGAVYLLVLFDYFPMSWFQNVKIVALICFWLDTICPP